MKPAQNLFTEFPSTAPITDLDALLSSSDAVFIKRLALNDWQWVTNPEAHQGGFYIPKRERDSGFFPALIAKTGPKGGAVREATITIRWPQSSETLNARLVNYPSKGEETHLTGVAKSPLEDIPPTSLLIVGKAPAGTDFIYTALIVPAGSESEEWLRESFELPSDFHSGTFDPKAALQRLEEQSMDFIALAYQAFLAGRFTAFAAEHGRMCDSREMAKEAQTTYLREYCLKSFDPFALERPGDTLRRLSQDIEWRFFQEKERQIRSIAIIRELFGDRPDGASTESVFKNIIRLYPELSRLFGSAAQARKSRAGYSLEHHLSRMLADGSIPHESQVAIAGKRLDFVLPNKTLLLDEKRNAGEALVLSAKSTIRERWKQVQGESLRGEIYLATLDGSVAKSAVQQMAREGICLVVPESLKESKETVYSGCPEVIYFKSFFETEIRAKRMPHWRSQGAPAA